jgi:hypothetical protein
MSTSEHDAPSTEPGTDERVMTPEKLAGFVGKKFGRMSESELERHIADADDRRAIATNHIELCKKLIEARTIEDRNIAARDNAARNIAARAAAAGIHTIVVEVSGSEGNRHMEFQGRWLVTPDRDATRTNIEGYDAGMYWGVARTADGGINVYTGHRNDDERGHLSEYAHLDDAMDAGLPADIASEAASAMGEVRPVSLD